MPSDLAAAITVEELSRDPHPLLARLRATEPVAWVPAIDGWLVTSYELVAAAMRDAASFTVDHAGFSTARVVGHSMLSRDGAEHQRHRRPFADPFRPRAVSERFAAIVEAEARRLVGALRAEGRGELRSGLAAPLAAVTASVAVGLPRQAAVEVLDWYRSIVAGVTAISAGQSPPADAARAVRSLRERLGPVMRQPETLLGVAAGAGTLDEEEIAADAAVLLFGAIETTEGMIANALMHILGRPSVAQRVTGDAALIDVAVDESLRLEPAAAAVDRYSTGELGLGNARIGRGDLVRLSISAANRDPAVFDTPNRFRLDRPRGAAHLAFAAGPHVCLGVHLARLEARAALAAVLTGLPRARLDPDRAPAADGLVFRKPREVHVRWG